MKNIILKLVIAILSVWLFKEMVSTERLPSYYSKGISYDVKVMGIPITNYTINYNR